MSAPSSHERSQSDAARLQDPSTVTSARGVGISSTPAGTPATEQAGVAAPPAEPARWFGPYCIRGELNRGGMGIVYHVEDSRLGREVALKVVRSGALARPEELERFNREARAVAQLNHPHIVPLYDVGSCDGEHYFTMELARGGSLSDHRARLQADRRAAVALLLKVTQALAHVHAQGLLHRDLKPANILLRDDETPLVSDFGLAKSISADADLTRPGAAIGTPAYMAPEQAAGTPERVGPAADIWSLGVILYELICGARPFAAADERRLVDSIIHDPPYPPRKVRRDMDRDLETIVLKCLEKDAGQRYDTAAALADDLAAWLAGEPIKARPVGPVRRTLRWGRRHWRSVALAAVTVGILTAALITRPWRDPDQPLRDIEARLEHQRAVTLLDESGELPWSRELASCQVLSRRGDPAFTMSADQHGLLMVVPDPKTTRYRLQAEVRLDSSPLGSAGLFFGHSRHDAQRGAVHAFLAARVLFPAPNHDPASELSLVHFVTDSASWRGITGGGRRIDKSANGWHQMVVDASPETIRVSVDSKEIYVLREAARIASANSMLRGRRDILGAAHPVFWPGGGLGLFVTQGTASFRHIQLIPEPAQAAPE